MDGAKGNANMDKKTKAMVVELAARRTQVQVATLRYSVNR